MSVLALHCNPVVALQRTANKYSRIGATGKFLAGSQSHRGSPLAMCLRNAWSGQCLDNMHQERNSCPHGQLCRA